LISFRQKLMMLALIPLAAGAAYKHRETLSAHEECAECSLCDTAEIADSDEQPAQTGSGARPPGVAEPQAQPAVPDDFKRVQRPGSVDIEKEYNLAGLTIPKEQIHTLLPRDAIPALTDPKTEPADKAAWLPDDARIIEIVVGVDVLGVPLRVLDWHEIVNTTVGGEPIAATYCPLCDSATVFSRRVMPATPKDASGDGSGTKPSAAPAPIVLEFGVSGALYNSNVLMYDKKDEALWSQLGMHALSGPNAGTALEMLPVEVVSFAAFKKAHPGAKIVSKDTGHNRDYSKSPYESYFKNENLMVPVAGVGEALPRKTLGVGIAVGDGDDANSWFVPVEAIGEGRTIDTPAGAVVITKSEAGVAVTSAPKGVRTAQTFYYSWSAFYPKTEVVMPAVQPKAESHPAIPGLAIGDKAPDATVTGVDGKPARLADLYKDGPIVLTFYRGGWCPFCTRALSAWHNKMDALKAAGGTFVALTPEKPDLAAATREKASGGKADDYAVYSDGAFEAAKAFKVHFVVDEDTKAQYEKFGLKVAESNVSGTWELPAPATFVIDKTGVIRWAFADWDYKKRADPDAVIAAVKAITGRQ